MGSKGLMWILYALVAAIIVQSGIIVLSAINSAQNRRNGCDTRALVLGTLKDVVTAAYTPPPGRKLTAEEVRLITGKEAEIFARIDRAEC